MEDNEGAETPVTPMHNVVRDIRTRIANERKETKKRYHKPATVRRSETERIKFQKLKTKVDRREMQYRKAVDDLVTAEIFKPEEESFLEPDDEFQKTHQITQKELANDLDIQTVEKMFDLNLQEYGPYMGLFNRSGKEMLLAGKKGHFAMFDWVAKNLHSEIFVNETIHDATFLHSREFFALSQKKYVYIYNDQGQEVHCLSRYPYPIQVEFLPYHFLLVSLNDKGWISWTDTSTGNNVKNVQIRKSCPVIMRQNPWNAIICCGSNQGVVTMWSPNSNSPLASMLCHRGALTNLHVTIDGQHMVTTGVDRKMKVWDIRNTYDPLHEFYTRAPVKDVSISQKGMVAVSVANEVQVWRSDIFSSGLTEPYMTHKMRSQNIVESLHFCPFEDVLGIGHSNGFSTIVIPGSGEPNFDSLRPNPYSTSKFEKDMEVTALLEKIRPEMISLNPFFIGTVSREAFEKRPRSLLHNPDAAVFEEPRKKRRKNDDDDEDEDEEDDEDDEDDDEMDDYDDEDDDEEDESKTKKKKKRKLKKVARASAFRGTKARDDEKRKEFLANAEKHRNDLKEKQKKQDSRKAALIKGESVALKRFF